MSDDKISRRDLFAFWRRKPGAGDDAEAEPARRAPPPPPPPRDPLRPPGAIDELLFADKCTRCGKCVEVCPRQAIAPLAERFGHSTGTPAIVPRTAPCVVCEALACTRACPSGALLRVPVSEVRMGTAVVEPRRCVTWAGQACTTCRTSCPIPGALVADADGHPQVVEALCIGCGVCEHVCPTDLASIVVEPGTAILR